MKDTLYAIGEALIDFIPNEKGCSSFDVKTFSPKLGGAPTNVLGAFSKLGGKTELLTQLGNDLFGKRILKELKYYNIGTKYLTYTSEANTALAFVLLNSDGDREFSFYRNPSSDMLYNGNNLKEDNFKNCYALHFCSVSLGEFPMKDAHLKAIKYAKNNESIISFDPNIRLPLWKDHQLLKNVVNEFMNYANIVKVSNEEVSFITGYSDIKQGCKEILKNCDIVLCTCGSKGTYGFTKQETVFVKTTKVEAKDTTGAGDAFIGAFLYILYINSINKDGLSNISKEQLERFIALANNYATKSVMKSGAIESYPNSLD